MLARHQHALSRNCRTEAIPSESQTHRTDHLGTRPQARRPEGQYNSPIVVSLLLRAEALGPILENDAR